MENSATALLDHIIVHTQGRQVNAFRYLTPQILFVRNAAELKNPPGKLPHCKLLVYVQNTT